MKKKVHHLEEDHASENGEDDKPICTVKSQVKNTGDRSPPISVRVCVNNVQVDMEVDTGASVSLICEDKYKLLFPLDTTSIKLQTYLDKPISVVGSIVVTVEYEGQKCDLPLIVVNGNGPTLLGRNSIGIPYVTVSMQM